MVETFFLRSLAARWHSPEVSLHTSTAPVGFPSTAFLWSALKEESVIKGAHGLEGSLAQDQNLLKAPLELLLYATRSSVQSSEQWRTGEDNLIPRGLSCATVTRTREQTPEPRGGEPGDGSPLSVNVR
jgi:hypothetical protein